MIYRIYPNKDATIYEDSSRKNQNTGKDEILEVTKLYDSTDNTTLLGNSRALVQFDLTSISSLIDSGDITSPTYKLNLENTENEGIQSDYDLYVFPLKESWAEGIGSEPDTPHNENGVSWVNRDTNTPWDVTNSTVGKPLNPDLIPLLETYYDFAANVGNFELVEKIKGEDNSDPILFVSGAKLAMSSSEYGGGTANLSASFESGSIYQIDFDFDRGTLSGVDFNIVDPDGYQLNNQIVNFEESLVTTGTYNMAVTASITGIYKIQFTFFDNNGSDGSQGSIDNFYVYRYVPPTTLIFDQFGSNLLSLPSTYVVNDGIENEDGVIGSTEITNGQLFLTASKFGGASLNRKITLQQTKNYTASFDIVDTNYPLYNGDRTGSIEFSILTPGGRAVEESAMDGYVRFISGSTSSTVRFQAGQDGEYLLRWTFFGSGSGQYSASLDNIKLESADHDVTSSRYADVYYDADWVVNQGGGTWYTSSFLTGTHYKKSFTKYTDNLNVEVTDYVNDWITNNRANNGFLIKKSKVDEASTTKFGSIKFFSSDTHTIYPPTLEVLWDDSSFNTGSLEPLTSDDIILYVKGLATEYKETSKATVRVYGRDRFPSRSFTSTPIKDVKYLPTTLYYSVVDAETDKVIIPFDTTYTKVSCDSTSNYFNFWFNGLQPERFYKFIFRLDQNGTTKYYDDNFYFKVVR